MGRETEYRVGDKKAMFSAGLEKQQAVTIALSHSMLPDYTFPGGGVSSNSCVKVTKDDKLVCFKNGVDDGIEILIEFVLYLFWVGQGRSIRADNGGKLSSSDGESHRHQAIVNSLGKADQLTSECRSNSKTHSSFSPLVGSMSTPKAWESAAQNKVDWRAAIKPWLH